MAAVGGLAFGVLGGLVVERDGAAVDVGSGRRRALLGLLLAAGRAVSSDTLVDALWAGEPPRTAETVLQGYVSQLRKLLGAEVLVTEAGAYRLAVEPEQVDAVRFERLLGERRFVEALELWRGPALADFAFESWAQDEIGRLEEERAVARENLAEERLALGQHRELVAELEALVAERPLRERPRALLMTALYRSGRQAEALDVYQRGREMLVEELGIDPGPELQELHRAILNQDPGLAAPARGDAPATNIPASVSGLVGRSAELADLAELLARPDVRVVTLTGPGGTGKTRLAIAAAAARLDQEPDGVWFVDLSALRDPRLVAPTVARTLGGKEDLDGVLDGRRLLLVLDNLEQVLDASVDVAALLRAHPGVRALVTSREPMRVEGEHQYEVPPLPEDDAVALFVERARAVVPGFEPDEHVAEICRRVDGLPLAVQLAAARVKLLAPEAILARLERRLPLLTHGARDLPERQRTLRATIAWSCELLGEEEGRAFDALAVFAGGFTLEAAEAVVEVDLDMLASLVDRSLVRVREGRFGMLETIREFAAERLGKRGEELGERHCRYFDELARRLRGEGGAWLEALEVEDDNLRAALAWAGSHGETELGTGLALELRELWATHGHLREGARWYGLWLDRGDAVPPATRMELLQAAGEFAMRRGDLGETEALSTVQLDLARELSDVRGTARAQTRLAWAAAGHGQLELALRLQREAIELLRASDHPATLMAAVGGLGNLELSRGAYDEARLAFAEALELALEHTRAESLPTASFNLGLAEHLRGDSDAAARHVAKALALYRDEDNLEGLGYCLTVAAAMALERGDPRAAALRLGAAEALITQAGASLEAMERSLSERTAGAARAALGEAFDAACAEGAERPFDVADEALVRA